MSLARQISNEEKIRRELQVAERRALQQLAMQDGQLAGHGGIWQAGWQSVAQNNVGLNQMFYAIPNVYLSNSDYPAAFGETVAVVDAPARTMLKRVPVTVENLDGPRAELARDAEALLGYRGLRKHVHAPGRLRITLAKLEIEILDEKTVDAYKSQMVEHFRTTNKMPSPTWRLTDLRKYTQPVPEHVLAKAVEIKRELPEAEFYVDQLAVDPFLIVTLDAPADYVTNRPRSLDAEIAAYIEVWDEPKFEA